MATQPSPIEEQEKLLDESLSIVKVQVFIDFDIDKFNMKLIFFFKHCVCCFIVGSSDEKMPGQIKIDGRAKTCVDYARGTQNVDVIAEKLLRIMYPF